MSRKSNERTVSKHALELLFWVSLVRRQLGRLIYTLLSCLLSLEESYVLDEIAARLVVAKERDKFVQNIRDNFYSRKWTWKPIVFLDAEKRKEKMAIFYEARILAPSIKVWLPEAVRQEYSMCKEAAIVGSWRSGSWTLKCLQRKNAIF